MVHFRYDILLKDNLKKEVNEMDFDENGLVAWELNAEFWDNYMGDESNYFHRDLVRPSVEKLMDINQNDFVLDIACGNGNYSERMAKQGAKVIAFDYSNKMIELAIKRRKDILDKVEFIVCDATKYDDVIKLKRDRLFTKAVANMAIMDISKIAPLFKAVYDMLEQEGIFVFATHHPCFTYENDDYFTSCINKGIAVKGQPSLQNYYHRSIADIFNVAFDTGFCIDGFYEIPFRDEKVPIIMIVRLTKKYVASSKENN
ncbi:methyltransferase [Candidatus Epulonipiscium fishelsonii]|uniref:Methyltransferase n=1 Tax=Candidatus Epulonipiscium fishelsonii TaxID=77094 RepID=A0ACC8XCQ2_9FIRM|nr:methyltransferase [Epulopiscium sp. SCG-B11WGA-EpuloA1]ONI41854.1 methyltransferase [Epulopiscium sp. SCG-B05WGA-EpuloA1]